jgi:hypothetical protein
MESQPRRKKGKPAQSTTGDASESWIQRETLSGIQVCSASPGIISPMLRSRMGAVSNAAAFSLKAMSASSGSLASDASTATGSSAIPHRGQVPGPFCRISGCIGQVYKASEPCPVGELTGGASPAAAAPRVGARYRSGASLNF